MASMFRDTVIVAAVASVMAAVDTPSWMHVAGVPAIAGMPLEPTRMPVESRSAAFLLMIEARRARQHRVCRRPIVSGCGEHLPAVRCCTCK
jgi:hypothetical protein